MMRPLDAEDAIVDMLVGVFPEQWERDGALGETAAALTLARGAWASLRTAYRTTMTDLTLTPFARAKATFRDIENKLDSVFKKLDKALQSITAELAELDNKHRPKKPGSFSDALLDGEIRGYLSGLPEPQMVSRLSEAAQQGDLTALRAALLAPPILIRVPDYLKETLLTAYAKAIDPEGFERREKLVKAAKLVQKAAQALMVNSAKLVPGGIGKAAAHDKRAAEAAEKLCKAEEELALREGRMAHQPDSLILRPN
ncbi:MAG: hypothetical protein QOH06_3760 [Acidobacteriota bacterium]|jgi:hypothetical protein|nr:hypothetical protein [Acidobacteriota bacterium]